MSWNQSSIAMPDVRIAHVRHGNRRLVPAHGFLLKDPGYREMLLLYAALGILTRPPGPWANCKSLGRLRPCENAIPPASAAWYFSFNLAASGLVIFFGYHPL